MLNLREYRRRPAQLTDHLPWAALVAPGIVLNKDGAFQRTAEFRGPDLDSATESELVATAARLNNALKRWGSGWAVFVEAERREAASYPDSTFPEGLSKLVDEERRAMFEEKGAHFESAYFLTLLYLPPAEVRARAGRFLFEAAPNASINWRDQLASFISETDRFLSLLDHAMPRIAWLSDEETLAYLHSTVSTTRHPIAVPQGGFYLDALLADRALSGGLAPRLGELHLRALTVRGFPSSTWPGALDELNRLGFPYRWMTRFLLLDKRDARRELTKIRRQWFAKRKGIVTLLRETLTQEQSPLVDNDAANKATDADAALQEVGNDSTAFGYLTSTLIVVDANASVADDKRRTAERVIQAQGFVCMPESFNAVEAWIGSLPGQVYANVRQPLVSTFNLAHVMPVSAVWAGPTRNDHLNGPPLMMTRTAGATPFRLNLHVGDVGHTLVVGPTGSGKSVLLSTLILQFRRYAHSRIFVFDQGRSSRATILGLGGEYYDLGTESSIAFQPLARIDEDAERAWAAEWIAARLGDEKLEVAPDVKDAVWSALASLASAPPSERTMTGLSVLMQSNRIRQALQPYTLNGPHGRLLDADQDRLGNGDIQGFEMQSLMHTPSAVLAVLTNLFHRLEARFDGAPTLLVLDEAWLYLEDPVFASRVREWLKTLRKRNVSVIFATQSLSDIQRSTIAPAVIESCPSRIFLPSSQATEPQLAPLYRNFGLNARQIDLIAMAQPKRDYYYQSPLGQRVFELGLGAVALAFVGTARPELQREIDEIVAGNPSGAFAAEWLRRRGLEWAANLIDQVNPSTEQT